VVSPPSASNLNSLLTGHVGQESERAQEDGIASKAMEADSANNTGKPTKKKESKKSKISKEGKKTMQTSVINMVWPTRRVVLPQLP
jgi:hypothetical protein